MICNFFTDIKCLSDPPERQPMGYRIWEDESHDYKTTVEYSCGPHAELLDESDTDNHGIVRTTCQWSREWDKSHIPACICKVPASVKCQKSIGQIKLTPRCPLIFQPPIATLFQYLHQNQDFFWPLI